MKDIADHLVDIIENSFRAGAGRVTVGLSLDRTHCFRLEIRDDGPGLPAGDLTDPFRTSRRERRVGLGLALLAETAAAGGGSLAMEKAPGGGSVIRFTCRLDRLDARPLGDLARALVDVMTCWPTLELLVRVTGAGGRAETVLDTGALRAAGLVNGPPAPEIRGHLYRLLRREMDAAGLDTQFGGAEHGRAG